MQYDHHYFAVPFDFTNVLGVPGTNIVLSAVPLTQGDFRIFGLTTLNLDPLQPSFNFYRLSWFDSVYGDRMQTDEMGMGAFEADAQYPYLFPVPWVVRKGAILVMRMNNITAFVPSGQAANISTQHVLFGELYPNGYPATVVSQPWIISLFFNLGFQEDTISGGNVVDSYNMYSSFSKTMDPLKYDFELNSITVDALNYIIGTNAASFHRLQITDRTTGRTLFDKTGLIGNVAGVRAVEEFTATGLPVPAGFPQNDTLQYFLPEPIKFKKGTSINIKLGMCFAYGPATGAVSNNNGECNVCLLGVKS